jgi:hypothetical protein
MPRAIAATTQVSYIPEVTDGTTPATPAFQIFRATGESLEVQRKLVFSGELNALRGPRNFALAARMGAGAFDCEFTDGSLEDMLEAALRGAWSTDVLVNANTPKPFTLETRFETGATDVFKRLRGAQVNTFSLNARAQEIVTAQVGYMSRLSEFNNALIAGATYTAGNTEPIFAGDKVGTITMAGLALDAVHTITMQVNNNLRARPALGSLDAIELAPGDLEVTGTVGLYLADTEYDVLTAFQDATATSLSFQVGTTAGKITRFEMPSILLEEPKPQAESKDGDLLLNLNFRAIQSSTIAGGLIRITRNI